MTSTGVASGSALQRLATTESTPSSSANISPIDSPRSSPSSTSLSSLASEDASTKKITTQTKLIDANGNPFEIPDYTIGDIHKAIPKHCFERSAATGLYYVARDLVSLGVTFYLTNRYLTPENVPSTTVRAGLWALYTFVQGLFGTGLWVLAHECGHQSFSPSKQLNDTVGWFCHSLLLVPYFSWKISHGKHHKATGHMERDMVFVPVTREEWSSRKGEIMHELHELTEDAPITTLLQLISQQIGGWPMYLLTNVTGHNNHLHQREGRGLKIGQDGSAKKNGWFDGVNHFDPRSPLYEAKDAKLIALSDLGIGLVGIALYEIAQNFGWNNLLVWYILPYLWVNHWLGKYSESRVSCIADTSQSPLPSCNTPIPLYLIILPTPGHTLVGQPLPLIANSVSLDDNSSTESSRPTSSITTSARFPFTTPMRHPMLSRASWASIIGLIPRVVQEAS